MCRNLKGFTVHFDIVRIACMPGGNYFKAAKWIVLFIQFLNQFKTSKVTSTVPQSFDRTSKLGQRKESEGLSAYIVNQQVAMAACRQQKV